MAKVIDLDVLKPESRFIKLCEKQIDVSFIPCAITFEVDQIMSELGTISQESILKNGDDTKRAFDLSVKLCSVFCEHKYPELDEEWFKNNCDATQIKVFVECIQEALNKAYLGVGKPKNRQAPKVVK